MKVASAVVLLISLSVFSVQAQEAVSLEPDSIGANSVSDSAVDFKDKNIANESGITISPTQDLNQDISVLKSELVDLRADLLELEQQLLVPPSSRLEVFFSMDLGQSMMPDAVTVYLDDQEIAHHLYTERQQAALTRGAVQPLFSGNISQGEHELRVLLIGQNRERELRRAVTHVFKKSGQVVSLEFSLRDIQQGGKINVIDHSPESL